MEPNNRLIYLIEVWKIIKNQTSIFFGFNMLIFQDVSGTSVVFFRLVPEFLASIRPFSVAASEIFDETTQLLHFL